MRQNIHNVSGQAFLKEADSRMKSKIIEQSILFVSVLKWFLLASATGVIVGLSTTLFLKGLEWAIDMSHEYSYYFLILPIAMLVSTLLVKYLAPEAEGHGTEKIIDAVHNRDANINPMVVPVKLAATIVTIASGGSAGKEGPCAQIGAGLASTMAKLFRFDSNDRRKLVICGISAGFATVFGTPIAGAMFGVEVLFVGAVLYDVLFPSFVAGIIGYQVSSALGITYFSQPISAVPEFSIGFFLIVCMSGLFFGLCSFVLIEMLKGFETLNKSLRIKTPLKVLAGGSVLVLLALIFGTRYLGLGIETIEGALKGESVPTIAFMLKSLFTSITLSFGGSGGIVTPIFFVGATSGSAFGNLVGHSLQLFAAIGMVALLAGAANTPISASIMAVELFGPQVASYAAVACIISYLITGHRGVYPSQVLAITKSPSISVSEGLTMEQIIRVEVTPRSKSLIGKMIASIEYIKQAVRRIFRLK
jgi:H+/Cl- antiporter ClcA